jgi:pyruvate-formate lyase-activating enzyme
MIPNERNFCGGNFQDWLEVMLTEKCNGKCSWCIEKKGYRPKERASWLELCGRIVESGKKNIILLGGEPTLYPELERMVRALAVAHNLNVYLTTNGSKLTREFVHSCLPHIHGVNISIHSYDLDENEEVTGIKLSADTLKLAIDTLHTHRATVRLNCNLIKGYIDSKGEIHRYIGFAMHLKADSIRFAELKEDPENFMSLHGIYGDKYGINNEPFGLGCNTDAEINGMPVNIRQMCGLQTDRRKKPLNPQQLAKTVLYYDGKFYDGWQTKENGMTEQEITNLLLKLVKGNVTMGEAISALSGAMPKGKSDEKYEPTAEETVDAALAGHPLGCAY